MTVHAGDTFSAEFARFIPVGSPALAPGASAAAFQAAVQMGAASTRYLHGFAGVAAFPRRFSRPFAAERLCGVGQRAEFLFPLSSITPSVRYRLRTFPCRGIPGARAWPTAARATCTVFDKPSVLTWPCGLRVAPP